jgi:addiction module RelE/StbE family toxin
MDKPLRWTRRALARLADIGKHISQDNPDAADAVVTRIAYAADSLSDFPNQGRLGRVEGTRELILADLPYIIVYRLRNQTIDILTVMHTARRWHRNFRTPPLSG